MDGIDLKTSEKPSAPRFVIPSAAEGSFWQTHNGRRDTAGKRNTKTSIFIFTLTWITAGQGRFLDFARNDVTRKPSAANVPPFRLYSAMNSPFLSAQRPQRHRRCGLLLAGPGSPIPIYASRYTLSDPHGGSSYNSPPPAGHKH